MSFEIYALRLKEFVSNEMALVNTFNFGDFAAKYGVEAGVLFRYGDCSFLELMTTDFPYKDQLCDFLQTKGYDVSHYAKPFKIEDHV